MKKSCIFILISIAVSACTTKYSSTGEKIYRLNQNGPMVQIPPHLSSKNISHFYVLPNQDLNPKVKIAPPVERSSKKKE